MAIKNEAACPICGQSSVAARAHATKDVYSYECPVCGDYAITRQAESHMKSVTQEDKAKISAYTRERHIHQQPKVTILSGTPRSPLTEGAVVGIDDILKTGFPRTVSERLNRALKNLHKLSPRPGKGIPLSAEKDYPVLFAENEGAFVFLRNALQGEDLIEVINTVPTPTIILGVHGWNRIAELEQEIKGRDSKQAFVAMWFDDSLDKAYSEGFEKAIKAAGYEPLRVDLKEHNQKIDDTIVAEIRKSRFMIADFTGHRGGVYYEAGFAKGLGMEVIWTCREDHIDKSHFDTRQYNHIIWKDEKDLCEKLQRRIEATIPAE